MHSCHCIILYHIHDVNIPHWCIHVWIDSDSQIDHNPVHQWIQMSWIHHHERERKTRTSVLHPCFEIIWSRGRYGMGIVARRQSPFHRNFSSRSGISKTDTETTKHFWKICDWRCKCDAQKYHKNLPCHAYQTHAQGDFITSYLYQTYILCALEDS